MITYRDYKLYWLDFNVSFRDVILAYKANPIYGDDTASLAGLARALSIPLRTAQNWASGTRVPPDYVLCLICYTLYLDGCSVLPLIV